MRIGLIGAGAVGSLLASALVANQRPLSWVVRNPQRREQLERGLAMRLAVRRWSEQTEPDGAGSTGYTAPEIAIENLLLPLDDVALLESAGELPELDWLFIAVKAHQLREVLQRVRLPAGNRALIIANGLHEGPFHLGVLNGGAYIGDGGELVTTDDNDLIYGELGLGWEYDEAFDLLGLMDCPWLQPIPDSHLHERMWVKLALNCVVNPLTALLDCPNGHLLPLLDAPLIEGVLTEVHRLINEEVDLMEPISRWDLKERLRDLLTMTAGNSSSMREDLRRGRQTEIREINLAVARHGDRLGLPCPLTHTLGEALLALEGKVRQIRPDPGPDYEADLLEG